jgi:hypothetical protein
MLEDAPCRAIDMMRPVQMGLKAPRGVEAVAHLFRALYWLRFYGLFTDFTNGFNAFLRQAMLDAVNEYCPGLNALFNLFYALDSMCFMLVEGEYEIIWSQEGSRMGAFLARLVLI